MFLNQWLAMYLCSLVGNYHCFRGENFLHYQGYITAVNIHHITRRNIPEGRRLQLFSCYSWKFRRNKHQEKRLSFSANVLNEQS